MGDSVITDRCHALAFSMELLGRESELAGCLTASRSPQTPAGIVIAGQPGIGKTTLFRAASADEPNEDIAAMVEDAAERVAPRRARRRWPRPRRR